MTECGIAFSGSGFRFPTHIGAAQAILDNGYKITEVSGCSGGSIVAAFLAKGVSPIAMLDLTHKANFQDFMNFDMVTLILNGSFDSGNNLLEWLESNLGKNLTFKDLDIPLSVVATDLNAFDSYVFDQKNTPDFSVALACRISASIPVIFQPYESGNMYLVDGGVSDDLPVNYLTGDKVKFAIELFEASKPLSGKVSFLELMSRILDTFMSVNNGYKLKESLNAVPIKINTPPNLSLDTKMTEEQIDQLYTLGYEVTKIIISKL